MVTDGRKHDLPAKVESQPAFLMDGFSTFQNSDQCEREITGNVGKVLLLK
jgi:hypothetical protein